MSRQPSPGGEKVSFYKTWQKESWAERLAGIMDILNPERVDSFMCLGLLTCPLLELGKETWAEQWGPEGSLGEMKECHLTRPKGTLQEPKQQMLVGTGWLIWVRKNLYITGEAHRDGAPAPVSHTLRADRQPRVQDGQGRVAALATESPQQEEGMQGGPLGESTLDLG